MKVHKTSFIALVVIAAFLCMPNLTAIPQMQPDASEGQATVVDEGKADLIIEWLGMGGDDLFIQSAMADVRNIGEADVTGALSVWFLVRKWGIFPVYSDTVTENVVSWRLTPGGPHKTFILVGGGALPRFGIYRFDAEVNPDRKFEESDYSNNWRTSWLIAFSGRWFKFADRGPE